MQNLREIGSRYNGLQDALDAQKAALRGARDPQERRALRRSAAETRRELKRLKASLSGEALQAYRDYRAIRRDIRRCDRLKRYDRVESRIFRKVNPAYIYILPAAFHAVFFTLMPFLFMIVGAFFKLDLVDIKSSRFVGWWNFRMVLALDDEFWRAFVNTIMAIFGIQGPNWLMNARTSLLSVALVTVWKSIGYYCLIIIAGLQSLPRDVYEAARLDKASRWTILRKITLPLMTPTLSFVFIMKFINAFKSFSAIDVMTQGGPQGSSMVLGYWIYNAGRVKFNYGFAMVGAIVLTVLVAVFTLLANKGFRKED